MGQGFDGEKFLVTTNEVGWFFLDGTTYINAGVPQYYYPASGEFLGSATASDQRTDQIITVATGI